LTTTVAEAATSKMLLLPGTQGRSQKTHQVRAKELATRINNVRAQPNIVFSVPNRATRQRLTEQVDKTKDV